MQNSLLLLGELSEDSMGWFSQMGQRIGIKDGELLIREGEPLENIFILLSGNLVVTVTSPEMPRHQRQVARLTVGEVIGEMSFVDQRPPSATVTAVGDCVVLALPRTSLEKLAEQDVEFGRQFYRGLAYCLSNRLRMMNVSLPQAGIEVSGQLPPELNNSAIHDRLPIAKSRLATLIGAAP